MPADRAAAQEKTAAGRGVEASLTTCMGRMAAHTGQIITREEFLNCEHEFAPQVDKLAGRIDAAMAGIAYELLIVDDNSNDGTSEICQRLTVSYPLRLHTRLNRIGG